MNAGFPRSSRLLRGSDFERVMRLGRKAYSPNLIVFTSPNDLEHPRLGLAVGRRVGHAACRNRWKRLIREVFRLHLQHRLPPIDIVVAVRAAEGRARKGRASPTEKLPMRKASGLASVKTELINAIKRVAAFQSISKE